MSEKAAWLARDKRLELGARSIVVGILNVTPDSFSDGGVFIGARAGFLRACELFDEGAGLVDIGGESTRPGYEPVSVEEEIERVVPVIETLVAERVDCIVSIDTSKATVAEAALKAGASVVNDVWGFQKDLKLAEVSAAYSAGVILMRNGRDGHAAGPVLDRIRASWEKSVRIALEAGVLDASIVLDPGVGFGTTREEDLEILRGLDVLKSFGFPLMLGASRKRITAMPTGLEVGLRLEPTLATTVAGIAAGVDFFRVHDVAGNVRAAGLADLIYRGGTLNE